ncbi:putative defense protein Hdd11 [Cebidichthys violaceus]|uniref:putative defense protein Hdd11 n=1 Tax=Cebidichthys violaceus TaxID=271503 RepID=UPI0035CA46DA
MLQLLGFVGGYPSGAPTGACEDMLPQPSPAPDAHQPPGLLIAGPEYRGVLVEARTDGSTNALGSWQIPPPDTRFLQCAGNLQGAVTHFNTNLKGNITVYSWIPPNSTSHIYFIATVAQQRTVFWVNVKSNPLIRGAGVNIM